jgi:hypothetical protein
MALLDRFGSSRKTGKMIPLNPVSKEKDEESSTSRKNQRKLKRSDTMSDPLTGALSLGIKKKTDLGGVAYLENALMQLDLHDFNIDSIKPRTKTFHMKRQHFKISTKDCRFRLEIDKTGLFAKTLNYSRICTICLAFLGVKNRAQGTISFTFKDLAYTNEEDQIDFRVRHKISKSFSAIASMPSPVFNADLDKLICDCEIKDASVSNVVIGDLLLLLGIEQSDLPVCYVPQKAKIFEYQPLTEKGLNKISNFAGYVDNVLTKSINLHEDNDASFSTDGLGVLVHPRLKDAASQVPIKSLEIKNNNKIQLRDGSYSEP